ncbi:hypothetical protein [Enteractinococcus helveticum]|uniref:hypothetical protein n=1 Tax=Enteractinococcus helveticum TaxID=1837282 RepID=UPI0013732562|nr:hypothetical protein [Enteractinococcus helveticum]
MEQPQICFVDQVVVWLMEWIPNVGSGCGCALGMTAAALGVVVVVLVGVLLIVTV